MLLTLFIALTAQAEPPRVLEPKESGLATNGAVVVRSASEPKVKVRVDGRRQRVDVEPWPDGTWLVRAEAGAWPSGVTLDLRVNGEDHAIRVGEEADEKPPDLLSCQAPEGTTATCGASFDMADRVARVRLVLASGAVADQVIELGGSSVLTLPEADACATEGTIRDTAGNERALKPAALPCQRPGGPKLAFRDRADPFDPLGVHGAPTPLVLEVELPPGTQLATVSMALDKGLPSCTECDPSCAEPAGRRAEFARVALQPDPNEGTVHTIDIGAHIGDWHLLDLGVRAFLGDVSAMVEVPGWSWCETP